LQNSVSEDNFVFFKVRGKFYFPLTLLS